MAVGQKASIIIYILIIIQSTAVSAYIFGRAKKCPLLYSLVACQAAIILWLFISTLGAIATGDAEIMILIRFGLIPISLIGPLWLIFTLYYLDILKQKNKYIIGLILLPFIVCMWPLLTDKFFYLIVENKTISNPGVTKWGILFIIELFISYVYVIISIAIIIVKSIKEKLRADATGLFLLAIIFPFFLNIASNTNLIKSPWIDLTLVSFSVFFSVISPLVFKYRFIKISPIASYELFLNVNEAAFIINKKGKIDEYNKACHSYFDDFFDVAQCRNIGSLLTSINSHIGVKSKETLAKLIEYSSEAQDKIYDNIIDIVKNKNEQRQYAVCLMPLKTASGVSVGKLIYFKDVTEYGAATLLTERSRLSNDLHDSLGNSLNVISSNLDYAMKNINNTPEVVECLKTCYAKTNSAFLSLRRIVDELQPADLETNGLLWGLESLFYKLKARNIHITFSHSDIDDNLQHNKKLAESIYRICQEAILNSVTHGKSQNININLLYSDHQVKLYINDDGIGCEHIVKNKGITSMEKRVYELSGEISYGSPSEGGFNIKIIFPYEKTAVGVSK